MPDDDPEHNLLDHHSRPRWKGHQYPVSNPHFDFSNKHVLVTGGTSGIGKAIATAFSNAGAQVIAAGLPEFDVTDPTSIATLMARVNQLEILVNAAGVIRR